MSRDLAHLAFFYFFFHFSCLYWILFFYLSMQIFALDNMRKREREMSCPYHNITSVVPPCRAGFAANIKNHTEPVSDVDAMGI